MDVRKKKSIRNSSVRSFLIYFKAVIYSSLCEPGIISSGCSFFEQYKIGHQTSQTTVSVPEGMQIFIKSMKSCRDDHRMDLPGVQDLLGALQQAGNLLYQLLMVPKYRITGTHVHCCIFSRVGRYFIVLVL